MAPVDAQTRSNIYLPNQKAKPAEGGGCGTDETHDTLEGNRIRPPAFIVFSISLSLSLIS